jgi:hypothetical protein
MAFPTPAVTTTTAATFIPEIWSDEIVAAYKKNLVAANLVKRMNYKGKKGDTVHVPSPTRGSASAKAASTAVTLIAAKTSLKFKPCPRCVLSTRKTLATLWLVKSIPT